ncbi:hypothetical protein LUZ63_011634 [Rhynchospora breviuscula]|uniref:Serine/threonine-protein phosphatase 4 regulatory subunit 3-like central domain-containing protein n=1 Tax=Rhynchospora breviuscula TaxID=2022672 RepID=A0A9Q0CJ83_9POAL|nr:hypothetical protein LUZ63_011634 [Rhynchospora breviuscula]
MGVQENSFDSSRNSMLEAKLSWKKPGHDHFIEFGFLLVTIEHRKVTKELGLLMFNEHFNEHIFFAFLPDNTYKRRSGIIIEWWQSTCRADCLLIFRDEISCSYIWGIIGRMRRDWHFNNHGGSLNSGSSHLRELPPVDLASLPLILKTTLECNFSAQMHIADLITQNNEFFPELLGLFRICEDSKNIGGLRMIYGLVRSIILLSNLSVFDRMFSDRFLMDVIGALEYDPEEPEAQNHRTLLKSAIKEHVIFKEVLPVKDNSVSTKLYQSYGAGYIKDVILPRTLDEVTVASLNLYIHANDAAVLSLLKADSCFIQKLLAKLKSDGTHPDSKRDLVLFFCELWSFNQSAESIKLSEFWWDLVDGETYNITVTVMQAIISQNDEHCFRVIAKNNLLGLIMEIFCEIGNRFNIFHGGVLELLEYIAEENVRVLVIYLWETFSEKLEKFEDFKCIQSLKIKYKQCLEDSEQKTENNAKETASNREEDKGPNKIPTECSYNDDSWSSLFHSFFRKFICEKEKVD